MKTTIPTSLHSKLKPAVGPQRNRQSEKNEDQLILQTVSGNSNEQTIRTKFVQLLLNESGAVGACFLSKQIGDQWAPAINRPTAGRLPDRKIFTEAFSEKCESYVQSNVIQTQLIETMKGMFGIYAPIRPQNGKLEILMIVVNGNSPSIILKAQKVVSALQLWLNGRVSRDVDWQVLALGSIIELVGKIEKQTNLKSASEEAANLIANRLGCDTVAVGLVENGRMRLKAISGVSKIDHGSRTSREYVQTLVESQTRREPAVFPSDNEENNFLLQAHKQLAAITHSASVRTQPLFDDEENLTGALEQILN